VAQASDTSRQPQRDGDCIGRSGPALCCAGTGPGGFGVQCYERARWGVRALGAVHESLATL